MLFLVLYRVCKSLETLSFDILAETDIVSSFAKVFVSLGQELNLTFLTQIVCINYLANEGSNKCNLEIGRLKRKIRLLEIAI